jgi:hypothetical protein
VIGALCRIVSLSVCVWVSVPVCLPALDVCAVAPPLSLSVSHIDTHVPLLTCICLHADGATVERRTLKAGVKTYYPKPDDYVTAHGRLAADQWRAVVTYGLCRKGETETECVCVCMGVARCPP